MTLSGEISGWQLQTTESIEDGDSKPTACVTQDKSPKARGCSESSPKTPGWAVNLVRFGYLIALTQKERQNE